MAGTRKDRTAAVQPADIQNWFGTIQRVGDLDGHFAHSRLLQAYTGGWECVRAELVAFLEDAHRDARDFFHGDLCLSLDSFGMNQAVAAYPSSLPQETLLGYFGEAFCGIISKNLEIISRRQWTVPVFLFRLHNAAGEHLHRLIYGDPLPPGIAGRTGSDFIALCLDGDRRVQALLAGEAKCHTILNITKAKTALRDLGLQSATPVSLGQLKRVLGDLPAREWRETVRSIEEILLTRKSVERVDLFVYMFEDPGVVEYQTPRLPETVAVAQHGGRRPLQVIEVSIPDLRTVVATVYQSLYAEQGVTGAAS